MTKPILAFLGAGDLASRAMANSQLAAQWDFLGVARGERTGINANWLRGNAADQALLSELLTRKPQGIVMTLVPNGAGEEGYRQGYLAPLAALLSALDKARQSPFIIFASSTAVYPQTDGQWVEECDAVASGYAGAVMLEAEALLGRSGLRTCALRFGGIYGPGRDYLIRQVREGYGGDDSYTNRIHQNDAASAIAFICLKLGAHETLPPVLNVCDSAPAASAEVRAYIASQLDIPLANLKPSASGRGGHKRVSNRALLDLGFTLSYPSFKEGYAQS